MVMDAIMQGTNIKRLVALEPLQQESTGHVDMFATLLDPQTIVVAEVDRQHDPINAAVLDRNVVALQRISVDGKPLRIHRIRIPNRIQQSWSVYTNVILTEKLLLMPTLDTDPPELIRQGIQTYQRLLPQHVVRTVNVTSMKNLQGSLHCLSLNLPEFAPWPRPLYSFDATVSGLNRRKQPKPPTLARGSIQSAHSR